MSTQFGNNVNQRITLSRKESSPYTNTLVCINKVWTLKPESPMGQPKLMNKGGYAMWFDSTFVVTFGNVMSAGTSKIKAIKDGKQVEFDDDKEIKAYKNDHAEAWRDVLGGIDFDIIEEDQEVQDISHFEKEPD
jgi:hypothetical protein